jgi:hypothetical protein
MGFIRKTAFLTVGVPIGPHSEKTRARKALNAQLVEMRKQTELMRQMTGDAAPELAPVVQPVPVTEPADVGKALLGLAFIVFIIICIAAML